MTTTAEPARPFRTVNALFIATLPVIGGLVATLIYWNVRDVRSSIALALTIGFFMTFALFPGWLGNVVARSATPAVVLWVGAALSALAIGIYSMRSQPVRGDQPTEPFDVSPGGVFLTALLMVAFVLGAWAAARSVRRGHPWSAFAVGAAIEFLILLPFVLVGIMTISTAAT